MTTLLFALSLLLAQTSPSGVRVDPAEPSLASDAPSVPAPVDAEPEAPDDIATFNDLATLLDTPVSSASKSEQQISRAPAVVSAFTRDTINAFGWMSLNDILYKQHGFAPSQDYDRRTVSSRGVSEGWNNNHYLLLIDGVPFNDNLYGTAYTWEITPLFLASTVEVTRGPGSALYGSNATGGVLSMSTVKPDPDVAGVRTRLIYGEKHTRTFDVLGTYDARQVALTMGAQIYGTDGNEYQSYDASGRTDAAGDLERFRVRDGRSSTYAFAKLTGKGTFDGFSLQAHNQTWDFETGHGWLYLIPDQRESMQEQRQILVLSYRTPTATPLRQEYVVRYQRHHIDWLQRYAPDGAYDGFYPNGVWEYLNTSGHDVFTRAQLSYHWNDMVLLGGVEYTMFLYSGDNAHWANANLSDAAGGYPPVDGYTKLGPWFQPIKNHPVHNIGAFTQLQSGLLANLVEVTAGVRYDSKFFNYDDGTAQRSKSYQQVNPRLAVVMVPSDRFTIKAMAGRAFRAPAPSEIFGANTFSLASNINALRPETITTVELALNWRALDTLTLRANGYYQRFKNQIAYSSLNLSTNIYSPTTAGGEAEALWDGVTLGPVRIGGFANFSYVALVDEHVDDAGLTESNRLVWTPPYFANLGVNGQWRWFEASAQAHWQSAVKRRASDRLSETNDALRGGDVNAWATLDTLLGYRPTSQIRLVVKATNLLNQTYHLAKTGDFAFDYRGETRRVYAQVEINLN